jgi:hypothetical protein
VLVQLFLAISGLEGVEAPATSASSWYFAFWWILWLILAALVARDPSYYPSRLQQLVNYRIFMQNVRSKHPYHGWYRWGWGGILALGGALVLTNLAGRPPVPDIGGLTFLQKEWAPILWMLGLVLAGWLLNVWLGLLGWAVEWQEMVQATRLWTRLLSHIWLPWVLLWALVLGFGDNPLKKGVNLGFGALILVTLVFRWFRQGRIASEFGADRLLLLIFYICTFEILPLTLIAHYILHG